MSELPSERNARLGAARVAFDAISIDYPPQTAAIDAIEQLRAATGLRMDEDPCGGLLLAAPLGTGKTSAMKQAVAYAAQTAGEGQTPILRVEMSTAGSTEAVPSSILKALGHTRPDLGQPAARWLRAVADLRARGVQVVVFDEFNRANRRPTMSRSIASSIREHIMDAGVAAAVFVGTDEAASVLDLCPDIRDRLEGEIDMRPLDWFDPGDRELFVQFLDDLDGELVSNALLDERSDLAREDVAPRLCAASGGRLRPLMRTLRSAMVLAVARHAPAITFEDLRDATDAYAVRLKIVTENPFG